MNNRPEQKNYWNQAGDESYASAMYQSDMVADRITRHTWDAALDFAHQLGVRSDARVMDLGCGDGAFANQVLAKHFAQVDGFDFAEHAIARATKQRPGEHVKFAACDVAAMDYASLGRYDAIFMIGILHHIKRSAADLLVTLGGITDKLIILEPNGNHPVRKLLERTASYKAAGEDSFRISDLKKMVRQANFEVQLYRSINLFPNFTPEPVYKALRWVEPMIEAQPPLYGLLTNRLLGCVKYNTFTPA